MTKTPTHAFTYSRSVYMISALNKRWEYDKKNKTYLGTWTLSRTVKDLMLMAYEEFTFTDLSPRKDGSVCRIPLTDLDGMSPKLNDNEPNAHYGQRLILSALILLKYIIPDKSSEVTEKTLDE